jgi:hypothetical protein
MRFLLILSLITIAAATGVEEIVVDPSGKHSGKHEVSNVYQAKELARTLKAKGVAGVIVTLAPGRHFLEHRTPLTLDSADSGVAWRGSEASDSSISGGVQITGWASIAANSSVVAAAVPPSAFGLDSRQLYVDGRRAARPTITPPADLTRVTQVLCCVSVCVTV